MTIPTPSSHHDRELDRHRVHVPAPPAAQCVHGAIESDRRDKKESDVLRGNMLD